MDCPYHNIGMFYNSVIQCDARNLFMHAQRALFRRKCACVCVWCMRVCVWCVLVCVSVCMHVCVLVCMCSVYMCVSIISCHVASSRAHTQCISHTIIHCTHTESQKLRQRKCKAVKTLQCTCICMHECVHGQN